MYPARLTSDLTTYASLSTKGVVGFKMQQASFDSVAILFYDYKKLL